MAEKEGISVRTVVVRKNRSHRVFALVACIVMTLVPIFVSIATRVAMGMVVLCFSPALLIAYALAWYDCSWKLILASGGITKSIWGVEGKCHSYQEIQAAVSGYSGSDRAMIVRIVFSDGKAVKFRMDDDNAVQARSYLLSRHSIRDL